MTSLIADYPYLQGLLILLLTVLTAQLVNLTFEHLVNRAIARTKTDFDDQLVAVLKRPIFWSILLGGLLLALASLPIPKNAFPWLQKILTTFGLAIWGWAGVKVPHIFFDKIKEKVEPGSEAILTDLVPFLDNVFRFVVATVVLLTVLSLWGIDVTPALASAGVAGVAVAFAAKDTVSNLFGGISVLFDKPYKVGDYVIINEKYRGEVTQIGMRSTKVRTRDNVLVTVPNAVMVTNAVINETGFDPKLRIHIPLAVAYGSDLERAEQVLLSVLKDHPSILTDPKPKIRYRQFGESGIELEAMGMIQEPPDRGKVTHELIKDISKRLEAEGIVIPFPQRDVHLYPHHKES